MSIFKIIKSLFYKTKNCYNSIIIDITDDGFYSIKYNIESMNDNDIKNLGSILSNINNGSAYDSFAKSLIDHALHQPNSTEFILKTISLWGAYKKSIDNSVTSIENSPIIKPSKVFSISK